MPVTRSRCVSEEVVLSVVSGDTTIVGLAQVPRAHNSMDRCILVQDKNCLDDSHTSVGIIDIAMVTV
jgi:hypothetical protein